MATSNLEKIELAIAQADDLSAGRATQGVSSRWNRLRGYGISIAGLPFILPVGMFCEFFEGVSITPLPNSPSHFLGLTNIRGNVVPVYDLARFIENEPDPSPVNFQSRKIVQLGKGEDAAALVCHQAPRTFDLTMAVESATTTSLPAVAQQCIARSLLVEGHQWHELNYLSLFQSLSAR